MDKVFLLIIREKFKNSIDSLNGYLFKNLYRCWRYSPTILSPALPFDNPNPCIFTLRKSALKETKRKKLLSKHLGKEAQVCFLSRRSKPAERDAYAIHVRFPGTAVY